MARGLHEPNSLHRVPFFYLFLARALCYCSFHSVVFCFRFVFVLFLFCFNAVAGATDMPTFTARMYA